MLKKHLMQNECGTCVIWTAKKLSDSKQKKKSEYVKRMGFNISNHLKLLGLEKH